MKTGLSPKRLTVEQNGLNVGTSGLYSNMYIAYLCHKSCLTFQNRLRSQLLKQVVPPERLTVEQNALRFGPQLYSTVCSMYQCLKSS
jgi:hypothetical protein